MVSLIDVIELAYRLDLPDLEWLRGLGKAVRPILDGERGLLAYLIDNASPAERYARRVVFDVSAEDVQFAEDLMARNAQMMSTFHAVRQPLDASAVAAYRRAGLGDASDKLWIRDAYDRLGITDYATLQTVEPGPRSVVFVAGQRATRAYDPGTLQVWAKVASHIAAGRRLRTAPAVRVEAVLTAAGRVEHAEGEGTTRAARAALREAVGRQEHARSIAGRKHQTSALDEWTALVGGRWSLVDHIDRGRRYLVARPNEHGLAEPRVLTPRERTLAHLSALGKPTALIAYELGIGESTVETHVAAVMKKLGAATRIELLRRLVALG